MTNEEQEKIWNAYCSKFGDAPTHPPLDLGHILLTSDEHYAYMQAAIDANEPIDWYKIFPPLPEDALS